ITHPMEKLTSVLVKAKAREFGADLVGIASGAVLDAHPPDPRHPQTPTLVSPRDNHSVIILAKRHLPGPPRLKDWTERLTQHTSRYLSQKKRRYGWCASLKMRDVPRR